MLQRTIEGIRDRTRTPYNIIVVDNNSTEDDTVDYLIKAKKDGIINTLILNGSNEGLAPAYNIGFLHVKSELFFTANDDLVVPDLEPDDWIQTMIKLFNEYYPEYGSISMRCARLKNVHFSSDWVPHPGVIGEARSSAPALFRLNKKSDILKDWPWFGTQGGYNDEYQFKKKMNRLGFRAGFAANVWCNHIGWSLENRGYPENFKDYAGHSKARNKKNMGQKYPPIDNKTNVPLTDWW